MYKTRRYRGKQILLGEYTVLTGSSSLAVPVDSYSGEWKMLEQPSPYYESLLSFGKHVHSIMGDDFDFVTFGSDLQQGLHFESSIPQGYGCGSSGAVVAAVYDRYVHRDYKDEKIAIDDLRNTLASLERYYHGESSGIDPLVILLDRPIKKTGANIELLNSHEVDLSNWYLIDSKIEREAEGLIASYRSMQESDKYAKELQRLHQVVDECIKCKVGDELHSKMKELSEIQLEVMTEMITPDMKTVWSDGLSNNTYYMKLSGAGGGGFYQLYSKEHEAVVNGYNLIPLR